MPQGNPLFYGDVIVNERDFPVYVCLDHAQRRENINFIDDQKDRELDIKLLMPYDCKSYH